MFILIQLFGIIKLCFHVQIEHSTKEESCLAIVHSHQFIQFKSFGMAWIIPQLWNHLGYLNAFTSFLGQKSQNTLGRCMRYLWSKNSFFTGVPFLILGRKVFNCQHGIDRTAGEKRKRKDAEEVLYIIISFYPQPLCFCQLWLANSKGQIHEWVI